MTDLFESGREYVQYWQTEIMGEEDTLPPTLAAVLDSGTGQERVHLWRAFLTRHDSLADSAYRIGAVYVCPRLAHIATLVRYES